MLLPALARDPRVPAAFLNACLDLAAAAADPSTGPDRYWAIQVLAAAAGNPALPARGLRQLAELSDSRILIGLLTRPGLTAAELIPYLTAAATPLQLRQALRDLPDTDSLFTDALRSYQREHRTGRPSIRAVTGALLSDVVLTNPDSHRRVHAAAHLVTDTGGAQPVLALHVQDAILDLACRVPGTRPMLHRRCAHARLRGALAAAQERADRRGDHAPVAGDHPSRWEDWFTRDTTTTADVLRVLDTPAAAHDPGRSDIWRSALRLTDDPTGDLTRAAIAAADPEVLSAVVAATHLPLPGRRAAALDLLRTCPTDLWLSTAMIKLLRGAPTYWARQVIEASGMYALTTAALRQPGVATPELLDTADVAVTSGALRGLGSTGASAWNMLLLSAPGIPEQLRRRAWARAAAAADQHPAATRRPLTAALWAQLLDVLNPDSTHTGGELLTDLPLPTWELLAHRDLDITVAGWMADAATELIPVLADPGRARCVLQLLGPGEFAGTVTDLIAVVTAMTAPVWAAPPGRPRP
jgi:hypothetical protein